MTPRCSATCWSLFPPAARDTWVDRALGLDAIPEDGPELPRGCVPYLPCPVDALLRLIAHAPVGAADVFVDVGSGLGRAAALVHLLTGAPAIGVEVQPAHVAASRALAMRLRLRSASFLSGDAAEIVPQLTAGSVFFLYCPFSGDRLVKLPPIRTNRPQPPDSCLRRRSPSAPLRLAPGGAAIVPRPRDLSQHRRAEPVDAVTSSDAAPAHSRGYLRRHEPRGDRGADAARARTSRPRRRRGGNPTARRRAANGVPQHRLGELHPPPGIRGWTCMFKTLAKSEVPIGTEIWCPDDVFRPRLTIAR